MKNPFRKGYEISLNRVHDTVRIKEGDQSLTLTVNGDAQRMVAGIMNANKKMQALKDESTDEEAREAATYFAGVLFGREQAEKLLEFYADDPGTVITVCGRYFKERLANQISKVQKKMKL